MQVEAAERHHHPVRLGVQLNRAHPLVVPCARQVEAPLFCEIFCFSFSRYIPFRGQKGVCRYACMGLLLRFTCVASVRLTKRPHLCFEIPSTVGVFFYGGRLCWSI